MNGPTASPRYLKMGNCIHKTTINSTALAVGRLREAPQETRFRNSALRKWFGRARNGNALVSVICNGWLATPVFDCERPRKSNGMTAPEPVV